MSTRWSSKRPSNCISNLSLQSGIKVMFSKLIRWWHNFIQSFLLYFFSWIFVRLNIRFMFYQSLNVQLILLFNFIKLICVWLLSWYSTACLNINFFNLFFHLICLLFILSIFIKNVFIFHIISSWTICLFLLILSFFIILWMVIITCCLSYIASHLLLILKKY